MQPSKAICEQSRNQPVVSQWRPASAVPKEQQITTTETDPSIKPRQSTIDLHCTAELTQNGFIRQCVPQPKRLRNWTADDLAEQSLMGEKEWSWSVRVPEQLSYSVAHGSRTRDKKQSIIYKVVAVDWHKLMTTRRTMRSSTDHYSTTATCPNDPR